MGKEKKILWVHNFQLGAKKGGVWMFNQHQLLEKDVDLYYADRLRNPYHIIRHYFQLKKLAKNYEVIHAQYGSMVGLLTGLMPGKKLLSIKGSDWYRTKTKKWKDIPRILLGYFSTRFSLRFLYDDIIVMSHRTKNEIEAFNPKLTIHVVVDPIDLIKFKPLDFPQSQKKKVLFASVDVNNPVKRVQLAKAAFTHLKTKRQDIEWYVLNNVTHDKVNAFINHADVILLTSTHEGWPNVIKECLAANIPFVSTDVSDLELIAQQTKNCFVVKNTNKVSLADAIDKSLTIGKKENLRKFVKPFSMEKFPTTLFTIYSQLK